MYTSAIYNSIVIINRTIQYSNKSLPIKQDIKQSINTFLFCSFTSKQSELIYLALTRQKDFGTQQLTYVIV